MEKKEQIIATINNAEFDCNGEPLYSYEQVVKCMELYASQPINSGWVSADIANKILKARDAFVEDDYDEVYHQLCLIADPNLSSINHWGELEEIASGLIKPH